MQTRNSNGRLATQKMLSLPPRRNGIPCLAEAKIHMVTIEMVQGLFNFCERNSIQACWNCLKTAVTLTDGMI
jgi:hypothetical protein